MSNNRVRIGIDVGGTFTDAIIVSNKTGELIGKKKVPTTHKHKNGVSHGIVESIKSVLEEANISPKDVSFIAHGTTQATNSILEGDVAKIGLITFGNSQIHKIGSRLKSFDIAEGKQLEVINKFINRIEIEDLPYQRQKEIIKIAIEELFSRGAQVIVASEVYAVDNNFYEELVVKVASELGHFSTNGSSVSQLYGIKIRTRTAVINGGLIPKMVETAKMTEDVVNKLEIPSELMVMRSDGGVMAVSEMYKRPILTLMSGLAAGVAGVLMHEKLSNGIFIEVGGTSVDISVIKDGEVVLKTAQIGKNKTTIKSLDIRTLGIAGGSMIRISNNKLVDVGPRSAHLANLEYECFAKKTIDDTYKIKYVEPIEGDPSDYVVIGNDKGDVFSYTLAGAVNYLGYVPEDDYAYSKSVDSNIKAWEILGTTLNVDPKKIASDVVNLAVNKVWDTISGLLKMYKMDKSQIELVGGGGSASILTYPIGKLKNVRHKIAKNAPYISTIGVAMAMLREEIVKTIIDPNVNDIVKIRNDVISRLLESGAKEETISTKIDIDKQKNIVTAVATGSTDFANGQSIEIKEGEEVDIIDEINKSLLSPENTKPKRIFDNGMFTFWNTKGETKFLNFVKKYKNFGVVTTKEGIVALKIKEAIFEQTTRDNVSKLYEDIINKYSTFLDGGRKIPGLYMFVNNKIHNYTGIIDYDEITQLISLDLEHVERDVNVTFMIIVKK